MCNHVINGEVKNVSFLIQFVIGFPKFSRDKFLFEKYTFQFAQNPRTIHLIFRKMFHNMPKIESISLHRPSTVVFKIFKS